MELRDFFILTVLPIWLSLLLLPQDLRQAFALLPRTGQILGPLRISRSKSLSRRRPNVTSCLSASSPSLLSSSLPCSTQAYRLYNAWKRCRSRPRIPCFG